MKNYVKNDGFSVLMVPIVLSLILAFVALGIDFGRVIILKHQLQTVADASAIAGVSMIKLQFGLDEDGKYNFDEINIKMIDEKSYEQAETVYEKNMELLGLESKGIEILEHTSEISDEETFRFLIRARIPMFLGANFLGTNNDQSITVFAEAKPKDEE